MRLRAAGDAVATVAELLTVVVEADVQTPMTSTLLTRRGAMPLPLMAAWVVPVACDEEVCDDEAAETLLVLAAVCETADKGLKSAETTEDVTSVVPHCNEEGEKY